MLQRSPREEPQPRRYARHQPDGHATNVADQHDIDDPATTFGDLLSCLRLAAQASQNALGRAAGVNASYINRLERGERTTPTREVVLALARALQATPTERDHLLFAAGYVPLALQQWGSADPTLAAIVRLLTDEEIPPATPSRVRAIVEALMACWCCCCKAAPVAFACSGGRDDRERAGSRNGPGTGPGNR